MAQQLPDDDAVVRVRDLRMTYGTHAGAGRGGLRGPSGEVVCLLGPNGAGKTTTIEILEGFRMRSAARSGCSGEDPADADEAWRARVGVVLQSWRDHARWTPRRLLEQLGGYFAPYSTPERPRPYEVDWLLSTVGLTEQRRPQDRNPVRRAATPARRRRSGSSAAPSCSSWTSRRRASTRRPGGTSTTWSTGSSDLEGTTHPADHPRPGRGRAAGRPDPHPGRRPDRRRRERRGAHPPGRRHRGGALGPRTASGSCTPTEDADAVRAPPVRAAR